MNRVLPLALAAVAAASPAMAQTLAPPARSAQMPALALTQLDERALSADLDNHSFSLTFAQPVALQEVLLLLVRGTSLSIVPDPSINGMFIGELKNVTVRQALGLILEPFGLDFSADAGVVRVFRRALETRLYDVSVLAVERIGTTSLTNTDSANADGIVARVTTSSKGDVFADIAKGISTLLSEKGTFNVDRKAGLVQVTDARERLDRIGAYLDAVQDRVRRQVQIEARVLDVELNDEKATALDWTALGQARQLEKVLTALAAQGTIKVLANPRVQVLNNEPGMIKSDVITLSVTPQISPDGVITLAMTPAVATPQAFEEDMVARVADGETIVVAGFGRDRETVANHKHVELVVLLTPRIVPLP